MKFDWRLSRAAGVLLEGGVIVHATEAVFGIAARAFEPLACANVRHLKSRGASRHFIVIGQSLEQIAALVRLDSPLYADILASWPGPNSWILPALPDSPPWLADNHGRIAVRLTGHPQAAELCLRAGPLISTSANPPGSAPARSLFAARRYFGGQVDCYLPGRLGPAERPSQIRDGATGFVVRA